MIKTRYEHVWKLLEEYEFEVDSVVREEVECVLCKKILNNAHQGPCGCRYCKKCIEHYLKDGPKKCTGNKAECEEEVMDISLNIQIDHRANRVIVSLVVCCVNDGCNFRAGLSQIEEHIRICGCGPEIECIYTSIGCDTSGVTESTMIKHLKEDSVSHAHLMINWMGNVKNDVYENVKKIHTLEKVMETFQKKLAEQANIIESQVSIIENQQREFEAFKIRIESGDNSDASFRKMAIFEERYTMLTKLINTDNDFIWRIDQMSEKVKEACMGVRSVIYSDPFYSHKYGYKLRLSMHPNGYGFKEGSHLYVLFCVMKGEYDDLLSWPLKRAVTLSIINRNDGSDYCSYRFTYDDTEPSFRGSFTKPTTNMNMGMGNEEFVRLDCLFKYQSILRDDNIMIKCVVSP